MLKMTGLDVLFAAAGNLYLLLALAGICVALWVGKTWARKLTYAVLVFGLFIAPVAPDIYRAVEYRSKLAKATALFEERCKTAGEKIYKTVENVEGVLLIRVRPKKINFSDQYALDDPYGRDVGGEGYISSFLRVPFETSGAESQGFLFADVKDQAGNLIRYQLVRKSSPAGVPYTELKEVEDKKKPASFGVDYNDISLKTDRENWVAGGRLKIIDLNTQEIVAERTGFIFDYGLGNVSGGRGPWEAATSCGNEDRKYGHNARFVMKSIKPILGK